MQIDIYDFDKTVLPFDSGSKFALFCFLHYPYLIFLLPFYLVDVILFALHIINLDKFKKHIFCFVRFINLDKAVVKFWDKYENKIFSWFLPENRERTAVVISASPDFLLEEIQKRLKFEYLLCTRHNRKTGELLYKNCRNEEKVRRLYEKFPEKDLDVICVYSDSLKNDKPIFSLGKRCFNILSKGEQSEFVFDKMYSEEK